MGRRPLVMRAAGVLALVLAAGQIHCASVSPDVDAALARDFPPGSSRDGVAEGRERARSVLFSEGQPLDEQGRMLVDRLGAVAAPAVGYDAYPLEKTIGSGYARQVIEYCDLVAFDESGRVLGAIRAKRRCE